MKIITLITIVIAALWIQSSDAVKCYVQVCDLHREKDFVCYEANGAARDGLIEEDKDGCYSREYFYKGRLQSQVRGTLQRYADWISGKENATVIKENYKKGCGEKIVTSDSTNEFCFCFDDFCNKHFEIPKDTVFYNDGPPK